MAGACPNALVQSLSQRVLLQAQEYGEEIMRFSCFPVMDPVDVQSQIIPDHQLLPFTTLKELKTACTQFSPIAPFTFTLVDTLATEVIPPNDWQSIAPACLSWGDYLLWKSDYSDQASEQAEWNPRHNTPITFDMLVGKGQYAPMDSQLTHPAAAYHQINHLATQAWRHCLTLAKRWKN